MAPRYVGLWHPKMKVERQDPFPGEHKASKAELAAMLASRVEVPPKEKKPKVEGRARLGCALSNYLNRQEMKNSTAITKITWSRSRRW